MKGLCECGCGQPTSIARQTRNGTKRGDPLRWVKGHHGRHRGPDYIIDPVSGCWVWIRAVNRRTGYARCHGALVHVRNYVAKYGPVPDGLELDHLCEIKACVNPNHLEPVTRSENMLRYFRSRNEKRAAA